jgi:hypothetical protein
MTGTADTEAKSSTRSTSSTWWCHPDQPAAWCARKPDLVYRNEREKFRADHRRDHRVLRQGPAVLVGTVSVEKSEDLAAMLKKRGIKHNVLNAKHHACARPRSSPRPVARARSPSRPTWPAAAPTSCSAATPSSWQCLHEEVYGEARGGEEPRPRRVPTSRETAEYKAASRLGSAAFKTTAVSAEHEKVVESGRSAHPRHRTPRVAAHRQPAARSRRPSGRSGQLAVLPVARGRPDAHLRLRPHPDRA